MAVSGSVDMYAGHFRRSVATLIDVAVVIAFITWLVRNPPLPDSAWVTVVVAVAFPLLYEPLLSSRLCTIGQAVMGTRVRHAESHERITIGAAYKRFAIKYIASVFGSLAAPAAHGAARVSVWPNGDHRALHDLEAGCVVIRSRDIL